MSAFLPPSSEQLEKMRESIKYASRYKIILDGFDLVIDSSRCIVIWDDDNRLIHVLLQNSEMGTQAKRPIKIVSAPYDKICSISAYVN